MNLAFSSKAPKQSRQALEDLLFFNPRQYRVREGIVNSLNQFGHPCVDETADSLSVRVGEHEAQTLFAYDRDRAGNDPVGVVVFLRLTPVEITVLHVAVRPAYALHGRRAGVGLGALLVEKVQEIASQIAGVQRVVFFYRREVVLRLDHG
jgi:hypothetical protein